MELFEIDFLPEALEYLNEIPLKAKEKILFNMAIARSKKDPKLFKPLQNGNGTSELNILAIIIEFLHFGTKPKEQTL